tara:strand:- start:445 stop:630 length:186 start_codon:yes stop_codon:yes gene_type:complete
VLVGLQMDPLQLLVSKEILAQIQHLVQLHQQVVAQVVDGVPHLEVVEYLVVQVVVPLKQVV